MSPCVSALIPKNRHLSRNPGSRSISTLKASANKNAIGVICRFD